MKKQKTKFSVYLIKEGISAAEDILKEDAHYSTMPICNNGVLYYESVPNVTPSWVTNFLTISDNLNLKHSSIKAVAIYKIDFGDTYRFFALSFGLGKSLLKENVIEDRFGLKVVLNSIKNEQIRKISKSCVGTNQKQTSEQLPKAGCIGDFGFDINRDLIKGVSGKSDEALFDNSMLSGSDLLSFTASCNCEEISNVLKEIYKKYSSNAYKSNFAWVDNIKIIKDKNLKTRLEEETFRLIKEKKFEQVWMAVPEVINWENVKCFKIDGSDEEYCDIDIAEVLKTFKNGCNSFKQLSSKSIKAVSPTGDDVTSYEWSANKCLMAEVTFEGNEYCYNNGQWYEIEKDYAKLINDKYSSLSICETKFPDYESEKDENEDDYNNKLKSSLNESILTHKCRISVGGGSGNGFEPCDVFWKGKFIYVKRNGGSSVLSHLAEQAYVSCHMIMDRACREQLERKIKQIDPGFSIVDGFSPSNFEAVLAIIGSKDDSNHPKIPFFSKVSICKTLEDIRYLGYKASIQSINLIK